ncbi:GlsB/YeaQ/YmgE family stress response membrane protein [Bradyrhizobium neotropicale]|nr:GlsB/YeaQ/YmgE family stress response membrane protein [Bradyrhizobium neotropicale]
MFRTKPFKPSCRSGPHNNGAKVMLLSLITWLLIGAIAGWLASLIVKGRGLGLVNNILVGIVGAVIAGWLLPLVGFVFIGGILAAITNAVIGAVLLLVILGFVQQKAA